MKTLFTTLLIVISTVAFGQDLEVMNGVTVFNSTVAREVSPVAKEHFKNNYSKLSRKKEVWYDSPDTVEYMTLGEFHFAYFVAKEVTYTVVYGKDGKWLATESRIMKSGPMHMFEKNYPSYEIFPKEVKKLLKKNEYDVNPNEGEIKCEALMDAYKIEVNPEHEMFLKNKTATYYVIIMDGVCIASSESEKIETEKFYNFYDVYKEFVKE